MPSPNIFENHNMHPLITFLSSLTEATAILNFMLSPLFFSLWLYHLCLHFFFFFYVQLTTV